ncbi:uncharacterized protein F4812DRAFT_302843 [Daldinia caldariorum]|uniref:uncharacterized protein n=1 Tax=Daldinia caldariorum TaxID=326644 RepID=UPI0020089A1F|nr:uncharacterized protein F4812DRAFT_302843 [Daldinia caldariorum]KAI1469782.1 hypothetical protein F4812DRAFT_302843 [Daldinia caldariorum]
MADEDLLQKVHGLEDLDLAALLCLVSREHCIVSTEPDELDTLVEELQLVASHTFNLSSALVDCTPHTTLDDLAASIQLRPTTPPPPPQPSQLQPPTPRTPSASPLRRRGTDASYLHSGGGGGVVGRTATPTTPRHQSPFSTTTLLSPPPQIANVVLAKNLDRAPKDVQIQCLELLRTRRILTRTSVQTAPKQFLFVAVLGSAGAGRLVSHLIDFFYVSHWHDPEDGFAHLEELEEREGGKGGEGEEYNNNNNNNNNSSSSSRNRRRRRKGGETASIDSASSVVHRRSTADSMSAPALITSTSTSASASASRPGPSRSSATYVNREDQMTTTTTTPADQVSLSSSRASSSSFTFPSISESDIATLAARARQVSQDVDVLRYQMNIVSFLRMHRAVAPGGGGATPLATKHLDQLAKCLAALHGLDYVTPSLVALAVKKIYPHRIRIAAPGQERSMQWGSDLSAIEALLEGMDAEYVIEDVLSLVEAPL